jgi:hypothetical protein
LLVSDIDVLNTPNELFVLPKADSKGLFSTVGSVGVFGLTSSTGAGLSNGLALA